jgi:uncharacterized membrane protein YfcA
VPALLTLALVGVVAQLTAGSLGMGYGVITTSALLMTGMAPAVASASVHVAEIGTSASLGLSHWRLGNVDRRLVLRLGLPGAVGAFVGAVALSSLSASLSRVVMACVLVPLGLYLVARFTLRPVRPAHVDGGTPSRRLLVPLGVLGGVVDAVGGGGWGPVTTTTLLAAGRTTPRRVIGSVDAAKLLVTLSASLGFVLALGWHGIPLDVVLVLVVAGTVVAPLAAWLVSRLPHAVLGIAAGGLVVLVNLHPLHRLVGLPPDVGVAVLCALLVLWAGALVLGVRRSRRLRDEEPVPEREAETEPAPVG